MKPAKNLNGIFWVIEYWFKALAYKIWSTNTKPFSWESEKNLETLHKLSAYIGVSYKFVLKSVKGLNRISRVIEYWFKALECQLGRRIQNHVSGKLRQSFKLSKNFLPILGFRINLFRCLSKAYIESPGLWNIGSRL